MTASAIPSCEPEPPVWRPEATVAAIIERDSRFLLVEEMVRGELLINQPAGHLEPDESVLDACVRETLEETAHEIRLDALVGIYQWVAPDGTAFLRFTFAATALREHAGRALDDGIVRALWLTREDMQAVAARMRSPMILRSVDDYLAGRRFPLQVLQSPLLPVMATPI